MPLEVLQSLIDKQDTAELVRLQIAAILVTELANQQSIASAAAKDPLDWTIRVFEERSEAWEQFLNDPPAGEGRTPIVNVWWESATYDKARSNSVARQQADGVYNLDCYGYGVSKDDGNGGHIAGDRAAALEAQRAYRLIRNILMAAVNLRLQMVGVVADRWPESITLFQPQQEGRTVQNVVGARLRLGVSFNEFSPQYEGEALELVTNEITRTGDGKVILNADYEYPLA